MPHSFYLFLHITGLVLLALSLGGIIAGNKAEEPKPAKNLTVMHGVGLLFLLVAGFGMIARLGIAWPFPTWVWLKLGIWVVLGGFPVFSRKISPRQSWVAAVLLILASVILGVYQPF